MRKDLNIPELVQENAKRNLTGALNVLDTYYLAQGKYLVGDSLTIADIAAYVEIGQLQPQFTNAFDLTSFTNVQRWLGDMMQVPYHDDVHVVLSELGDISAQAPSMDTIRNANKQSLRVLKEKLAEISS